jgi:hypothetical protein
VSAVRRLWMIVTMLLGLVASQAALSQQVCKLFQYDKDFNVYGYDWSGYNYSTPAEAAVAALLNCGGQPISGGPCGVGGSGWYTLTYSIVNATENWIILRAQGSYPYDPNYQVVLWAEVRSIDCAPPEFDPRKNACAGAPGSCPVIGNPVNVALRAKVQTDEDYRSPSPGSEPPRVLRRLLIESHAAWA